MRKLTLNRETLRMVSGAVADGVKEQGTAAGSMTYSMDFTCSGTGCINPTNAPRCLTPMTRA